MLSNTPKKVSSFKPWHGILLVIMIMVAVGVQLISLYWPSGWVRIHDQQYRVLVADTPKHWFKGLSNRRSLGEYTGMIFIFPALEQHAMVMRDMLFPLDIVWIHGDTIVDMAPNLQPDLAKTESDLRVYSGRLPSDKVLELPAGFIEANSLKVGDTIVVAR